MELPTAEDYLELPVFSDSEVTSAQELFDWLEGTLVDQISLEFTLNHVRRINKCLEKANDVLNEGGLIQVRAQTNGQRKAWLFRKYGFILGTAFRVKDFVFHRLLSKLSFTKRLYFSVTKGKNRPLALSEILGRLISCGFEIQAIDPDGFQTRVIATKVARPVYDEHATYGPIIRLKRVGKGGKHIIVYKLRTMHPFSEYAQKYLHSRQGLAESGKFKDDFRVTSWGRILRKAWIDEVPMLWNLLKGDLKLVGVRPLSPHYLSLYPEDVKELRKGVRPGLIPPYYADLPVGFEAIVDSERQYLLKYDQHPLRTDLVYLRRALWNIIVRRKRSS